LHHNERKNDQPFHAGNAIKSERDCQREPSFYSKADLHDVDLARKFTLRQGLWIEDLRTPPGQECSNGSLILLAVVLWRIFV